MPPHLLDKLNKLRQTYEDGDESAKDLISGWEKDLEKAFNKKTFRENEITETIVKDSIEQIKGVNYRLVTNIDLTDVERKMLMSEKKIYMWFLRLTAVNFEQAIQTIENAVDFELEPFINENH